MPKHIGIVACSAEGAALCYRTICSEGAEVLGPHAHPEISMHTFPLSRYMEHIYRDDWHGVADLMLASAEKLKASGAQFLVCPDNTIHQAYDMVVPRTPLPWLHIAEVVAEEALRRRFRRLGILGTWYLTGSDVYPSRLRFAGLEFRIPSETQRKHIDRTIFEELVYGEANLSALFYFEQVIENLKREGCDAVVLGCTEIPLLVSDDNSPLPTLDSTRLLARAALAEAVASTESQPRRRIAGR